jgi:hypothetical protein
MKNNELARESLSRFIGRRDAKAEGATLYKRNIPIFITTGRPQENNPPLIPSRLSGQALQQGGRETSGLQPATTGLKLLN